VNSEQRTDKTVARPSTAALLQEAKMKMRIALDTETLSVEGIQYDVKNGIVELPDNLPPVTIKCLIEGHGMEIVKEPEAKKAKE
jgi:hypothetical protein